MTVAKPIPTHALPLKGRVFSRRRDEIRYSWPPLGEAYRAPWRSVSNTLARRIEHIGEVHRTSRRDVSNILAKRIDIGLPSVFRRAVSNPPLQGEGIGGDGVCPAPPDGEAGKQKNPTPGFRFAAKNRRANGQFRAISKKEKCHAQERTFGELSSPLASAAAVIRRKRASCEACGPSTATRCSAKNSVAKTPAPAARVADFKNCCLNSGCFRWRAAA